MPDICADCDSSSHTESTSNEHFPYGDAPLMLFAQIIVIQCDDCGFEWTDYRAEEARDAAIKEFKEKRDAKV